MAVLESFGSSCRRLGVPWKLQEFNFPAKWIQIDAFNHGKQFGVDVFHFFLPASTPDFQLRFSPLVFSLVGFRLSQVLPFLRSIVVPT